MANNSKRYQCPYCEYKNFSDKLISHINDEHTDLIPEKFTAARLVYNIRNKREFGSCMICKKPTDWNESTGRYLPFCSESCHDKYVKRFEQNMIRVRGKARLLNDMNQQAKMLANRRISGKYKFTDGGIRTYTGSYERKALEFLDKVLGAKSIDIMSPGPSLEYEFNGETHKWITDIYWISMNLIIEVKDGGDNPNKREMPIYRAKQNAKEVMITNKGKFNYLRLTNNNFMQLFNIIAEIKMNRIENSDDAVIDINEAFILHELPGVPIGGVPGPGSSGYIIDKGFNFKREFSDPNYKEIPDIKVDKDDYEESILTNDIISDKIVRLDKNNIPKVESFDYLKNSKLTIWKFKGSKKKFLEVASSKTPITSFYEALTGKKEYTKDQIQFDPLFEKINIDKLIDSIEEARVNIYQEAANILNKTLPYLPVINIPRMNNKLLAKYKNINIACDEHGYFLYNTKTFYRTASKKSISELAIENSSLLEIDTGTTKEIENAEVREYEISSMNKMINTNVDSLAKLNIEKNKFNELDKKSKIDSDTESIRIYGKTNNERYREKAHEFLKQDLPKKPELYNGIGVIKSESELRQDLINIILETYEKDYKLNRNFSSTIKEFTNLKIDYTPIDRLSLNSNIFIEKLNEAIDSYYKNLNTNTICKYQVKLLEDNTGINIVLNYNPKGYRLYNGNISKQLITEANTYNFELVDYNKADVERAKIWAINAMRIIIIPTNTLEELEFLWNQFEQQHYNLQRESDAMSIEIFGMDNNTHYIYLKRKFLKHDIDDAHDETYDGVDIKFEENASMRYKLPFFFSKNNLYYKYNQFSEGYLNVLFITGLTDTDYHSELKESSNIRYYNLDNFHREKNSAYKFKEPFKSYIEQTIFNENESSKEQLYDIINFIKAMSKQSNFKFVFEGSIIPELFIEDTKLIHKSAVICKQTSLMESILSNINLKSFNAITESIDKIINIYTGLKNQNDFRELLSFYEEAIPSLDKNIYTNELMPTIFASDFPFFTPNKFKEIYGDTKDIEWMNEYIKLFTKGKPSDKFNELNKKRIIELNKEFAKLHIDKHRILSLGWNPEIPFTLENRIKVDTKMNNYLEEIFKISSLQEKSFPIEIDDKSIWLGSKIDDDFQRMYSDSHRLLLEYEKANNYDSIKYELVKLWYISRKLDEIVYNKNGKYYKNKQLLVLRAWVINDFKKYLAIVLKHDSKFNFTRYFEKSEYAKRLKIDKRTLKYTYEYLVSNIKNILK